MEGDFTVPTEFGKSWDSVNSKSKQIKYEAIFKPRERMSHAKGSIIIVHCVAQL